MSISQTIIDNIFLDKKTSKSQVYPFINGISDHDAQVVILLNLTYSFSKSPSICRRVIDDYSVQKFIELGHESWESRILKISAPCILSPLTYVFNKILSLGIFPDRMKLSIIRPLYKKLNTKELENYRPISLLTVFSKILEKIIYKRLYSYLEKYKILSDDQFGFREKLSTRSAANVLINSILTSFDKNKFVGGLFCDITKHLTV